MKDSDAKPAAGPISSYSLADAVARGPIVLRHTGAARIARGWRRCAARSLLATQPTSRRRIGVRGVHAQRNQDQRSSHSGGAWRPGAAAPFDARQSVFTPVLA